MHTNEDLGTTFNNIDVGKYFWLQFQKNQCKYK